MLTLSKHHYAMQPICLCSSHCLRQPYLPVLKSMAPYLHVFRRKRLGGRFEAIYDSARIHEVNKKWADTSNTAAAGP